LSFALATVELVSSIGDLGLTRYGTRELVRHWDDRAVIGGEILALQVITSLAFSLAGIATVLILSPLYPKLQLLLLGMAVIMILALIGATESLLIASGRFFQSALYGLLGRFIYVVFGFAVLAAGGSMVAVMWGFVAGAVLESMVRLAFIVRKITRFSFRFKVSQLGRMLVAAAPFAVVAVTGVAFLWMGVLALELLKGDAEVGVFNVAYTLVTPFLWFPVILARTTFPGLAGLYQHDPGAARLNSWQWYRLLLLIGVPAAVTVNLMAGTVLSYFPSR